MKRKEEEGEKPKKGRNNKREVQDATHASKLLLQKVRFLLDLQLDLPHC